MRSLSAWLLFLGVASASSCGTGGDVGPAPAPVLCTLAGCDSGAHYWGPIALGGTDPTTLQVQACMNGRCDTQALRPVNGSAILFDCTGPLLRWCALQVDVTGGGTKADVTIRSTIPDGADPLVYLKDGDTYEITIGAPGAQPLLTLKNTAGYQLFRPNGPRCEPTCKQTELAPSP